MKKTMLLLILLIATVAVGKTVDFETQVQPIFDNNCAGCHGNQGGLDLAQGAGYYNLVGVTSQGYSPDLRVVRGDPGNSVLYNKISDTNQYGGVMPPSGEKLAQSNIDLIGTWITELAQVARLTLEFRGMNPHVGQKLEIRVVDKMTGREVGRTAIGEVPSADFDVPLDVLEIGGSYWVDFYADLSKNGIYDPPNTDHAWRMELDDVQGDATLTFSHNTNFVDIEWPYLFTLDLAGMTPHVGQKFELRVVDKVTGMEVGRSTIDEIPAAAFSASVAGLQLGHSYWIDFYADLSKNGIYDPPNTDHAWRMEVNDVQGDAILNFSHNTNFTEIDWDYLFTLELTGMTPHVGRLFELRVVDLNDGSEIGRTRLESIILSGFSVSVPGIRIGGNYQIDFYADHNQNGAYDAPPADHAWRMDLSNVQGDATLAFSHNTDFTDIGWPITLVEYSDSRSLPEDFALLQNYPNPFNAGTQIRFEIPSEGHVKLEIFNSLGQRIRVLVDENLNPGRYSTLWDGHDDLGRSMGSGVYFYRVEAGTFSETRRMAFMK